VAVTALSILVEFWVDRLTDQPIYPFLPGFAAIIASAAWAGAGPGMASTILLVIWSVFDLHSTGRTVPNIVIRCGMLFGEGLLLSLGSGRMWRVARDAARSEEWHRRLFDTASEGIWICDHSGAITWANARMASLLGTTVEDMVGTHSSDYVFMEDRAIERIRTQAIRSGSSEPFDRRLRRSDGSEVWVLASSNLLTPEAAAHHDAAMSSGSGLSGSVLSMMSDITERKRAEQELRRSETRFRNLFEGVLEGVYQSTPEGKILAANPMLLSMLGLESAAQLENVNIARDLYVDPTIRPRLLEQLEREGGFQNVEYELRRRDGRVITVLENARVVRDESTGAVLYYEGTLSDVTPRLRMEEQLRQAQRVEALGRLAAGIAHDFDNVLTVITGHAQLAVSELEPGHRARLHTEEVLNAAQRAAALTRQLLAFSRRKSETEVIDLEKALMEFASLPRGGRGAGAELNLYCDPECRAVYSSRAQINRILADLIAGATRAFPASALLDLAARPMEIDASFCLGLPGAQPGPYALLSALPANEYRTGSEDFVPELWPPALEILAAQSGGFTSPGRPTGGPLTLCVYLPRAPRAFTHQTSAEITAGKKGGETILLVDDQLLIRELSRDLLERQGYQVTLAADEAEADRISRNSPQFDLLIADADIGPALARRLRAGNPSLKVLLIAGYTDHPETQEMRSLDAAFLQKPFSADSLGRKIRQVLNRA
jgi:PAS domain S-box-containing protein